MIWDNFLMAPRGGSQSVGEEDEKEEEEEEKEEEEEEQEEEEYKTLNPSDFWNKSLHACNRKKVQGLLSMRVSYD